MQNFIILGVYWKIRLSGGEGGGVGSWETNIEGRIA